MSRTRSHFNIATTPFATRRQIIYLHSTNNMNFWPGTRLLMPKWQCYYASTLMTSFLHQVSVQNAYLLHCKAKCRRSMMMQGIYYLCNVPQLTSVYYSCLAISAKSSLWIYLCMWICLCRSVKSLFSLLCHLTWPPSWAQLRAS